MSPQIFHLPDLGEGLTEAVLVSWLVAVGDEIGIDQSIAEVETAKSIVEVPSPFAGTVSRLFGEAGDTVLTGAPLFEVGGAPGASDAESGTAPAVQVEHEAYRTEELAGSGNVLIGYGTGAGPAKQRRRRKSHTAEAPSDVVGSATQPTLSGGGSPEPHPTAPSPAGASLPPRTVAVRSPIVRRLARELGVDPRTIQPTGSDGAITRHDVLAAASSDSRPGLPGGLETQADLRGVPTITPTWPDARMAGGSAPHTPPPSAASGTNPARPLTITRVEPFSPLRKAVSQKLSQSRREIPEATVWVDVDVTELWALRPRMCSGDAAPPSFTALLARFTLLALERFPLLASRLTPTGDGLEVFDGVGLGIATNTPRGLMVPVIGHAEAHSLAALDAELRALAGSARDGRVAPERLQGSTFTLNNYGGFGVDGSAAIINYPEVAILGTGRVLERPWVVDGAIVPRRIMQLSLVFDHRVCDGGYAAGFLNAVTELLENPLAAYPAL